MKHIPCNLCGSDSLSFLYNTRDRMLGIKGEFKVSKCKKCSLAFINPQPTQQQLKEYYPSKKYYAYNKKKKKRNLERLREYLIRHYYSPNLISKLVTTIIKNVPAMPSFKKNGKILDLGCGTGETLLLLKDLGWDTYGIDMDKRALEVGKKAGLKNLRFGTYKALHKYPDNYFDAIRLYHVIEHLDDPLLAMKMIKKKLKKNGELIIGTPNIESFSGFFFRSYWYNLDSPRHLYLFSPRTLRRALELSGFKVKNVEYCSAGGVLGSLQYVASDIFQRKVDLIHKFYLLLLFYPIEWILDKLELGDVFAIKATK